MGRIGMHIGYCWESQKERDHQEDQHVGGVYNIKSDFREIEPVHTIPFYLAQDSGQWRALVNAVTNLRGSIKWWEVLEWLHN
jgi:hypothetical protein